MPVTNVAAWNVSTRAPVRGGDPAKTLGPERSTGFNPRPRARGRLGDRCISSRWTDSFNPRPRARGRPAGQVYQHLSLSVSTRAPVRGGDGGRLMALLVNNGSFQPAPPCEGATAGGMALLVNNMFQPAPPCEGATRSAGRRLRPNRFQPAPPCEGATMPQTAVARALERFNPRPRARGRRCGNGAHVGRSGFNPRPRARGRRRWRVRMARGAMVSTRAPVRGGDATRSGGVCGLGGFNPRPRARGRRRTACRMAIVGPAMVSTRAPVRGGDAAGPCSYGGLTQWFQPAPPCEGATRASDRSRLRSESECFNPRPRARGRPQDRVVLTVATGGGFNPRPRARGRQSGN